MELSLSQFLLNLSKGIVCRGSERLKSCGRCRRQFHSILNSYRAIPISPNQGPMRPLRAGTCTPLRSWFLSLCGLSGGGMLLSAIPCLPLGSNDKLPSSVSSGSLQNSAGSLSHHELVKNAAAITVDSACILLTHAALAAISLHKEYAEMATALKLLLEDHSQFVGLQSQEDDLWQDIIRQRVEIDDKMQAIEEANVMLTSAVLVVERAAEAAYQADAELSAMTAGQHLQLVQVQLDAARKVSQKAQEELASIQAQTIKGTGDGKDGNLEGVGS